jgi:hypothetical protein
MVMILDSGHATAVPPSANINRHLPISIATRPALNWDHHRCKGEKNITPQPAGLARGVGCLYAQSRRYQEEADITRRAGIGRPRPKADVVLAYQPNWQFKRTM